jgi:hypothetical protein
MNLPSAHCRELVEQTAAALDIKDLEALFVSTQRHQLDLCIKSAIQ